MWSSAGINIGPLLFLIYVNDLQYASHLLQPHIMFADDTNLFHAERDLKKLFQMVNNELQKVSQWFISNKLSINVTKTKYSFFHKPSKRDHIPLALPKLYIDNNQIQRSGSIEFLSVFLDENLTWKELIKYTENKIAKNIGIIFRSKPYLNKKYLLSLYYSYIHSYISYASISWGNNYLSNLKKISSQQKRSVCMIYNKMKYESVRELLRSLKILNVYQINILNNIFLCIE